MKKRFKLGLEIFSYHLAVVAGTMDLLGFVRRCAELGLEGVQLNYGYMQGPIAKDPALVERIRALTAELGLFMELDVRGTDPTHLTNMLRLCRALGGDVLRTYASCGGDLAQELAQAPGHLRAVLPICEEVGIPIAVENHEYETAAEVLSIVEQVNSPWVGTHVDTGNSMMVWEDPVAAVRTLAPRAKSSHFKDHLVIVENGIPHVVGVTQGTGSIDSAACFRILAEESPLERLIVEVCYAYSAPFRLPQAQGAGAQLGEGAFRVVDGPHDPAWIMPHPEKIPRADWGDMIAWQDASVRESVRYVKQMNEA